MIKRKTSVSLALLVIFCSFTFCSCLSIDRNIKLNKDGSGEETMSITFQKTFYSMMSSMSGMMDSTRKQGFLDSLYSDQIFLSQTKDKYDSISGIKLIDIYTNKGMDSSNSIVVKYQFDSVAKIAESLNTLKDEDKSGSDTYVTWKNEDGKMFFNYFSEQSSPSGVDMNDSISQQMKTSMAYLFQGGSVNTVIEFPFDVISSNATSSAGNILTWSYPMTDIIMDGKMNLETVMKAE
ncbi:MAG: hypothetical protein SGI89_10675 [bacterium]|nr:hypothetical protein [bacterium]